ncbi:PQQ-dependent sugar dehydrogenase [Sunxiuqinia sp. sy24]|uniref:PQQ-dependent sugar dehydrogenase n=1 Tax=Sunxiuqinia sp. sy24 TaxID=3461495 RepID=UPI004045C055
MVYSQLLPHEVAEIIVDGLPHNSQHAAKPLTFNQQGNLYVTIGAPSNACMEHSRTRGLPGMNPCPLLERHAGIWRFKADQLGQDQVLDGERFATGIWHAVALDWNSAQNKLFAVQHGRDQLSQLFPQLYDVELPGEEFLLVEKGSDFGWPYCYYDPMQQKKVLGPE